MTRTVRSFSDASTRYNEHAGVQKAVAADLAAEVDLKAGQVVLDAGTGTGFLLDELRSRGSGAFLIGVDASMAMLSAGSGVRVGADILRLPFKDESLDLVVSSSCYQWAPDLGEAFAEVHRVLKPGGRFQAALFGSGTMKEFRESFAAGASGPAGALALRPLPSCEDAGVAVAMAGFSVLEFKEEARRGCFASVRDAWRWLQAVGANALGERVVIGRQTLLRAEAHYAAHGDGRMTFAVITINAQK